MLGLRPAQPARAAVVHAAPCSSPWAAWATDLAPAGAHALAASRLAGQPMLPQLHGWGRGVRWRRRWQWGAASTTCPVSCPVNTRNAAPARSVPCALLQPPCAAWHARPGPSPLWPPRPPRQQQRPQPHAAPAVAGAQQRWPAPAPAPAAGGAAAAAALGRRCTRPRTTAALPRTRPGRRTTAPPSCCPSRPGGSLVVWVLQAAAHLPRRGPCSPWLAGACTATGIQARVRPPPCPVQGPAQPWEHAWLCCRVQQTEPKAQGHGRAAGHVRGEWPGDPAFTLPGQPRGWCVLASTSAPLVRLRRLQRPWP